MQRLVGVVILIFIWSCKKDTPQPTLPPSQETAFIKAVDISSFPEIDLTNPKFYNFNGVESDFLDILKNNGVNTVRLRLWVDPANAHSGFDEVKDFSSQLRDKGFKIWLTVHYSDTWADPGQQITPAAWQGTDLNGLLENVKSYTRKIAIEISPDIIQIGNEINNGLLHPQGHLHQEPQQCLTILQTAITEVRTHSPTTQIMLHYAGVLDALPFYQKMISLDFDLIGLSYYPLWHGQDLNEIEQKLKSLSSYFNQPIILAETAYPFTLGWNDWTNNIIGSNDQIIHPEYPANPNGQKTFMADIKSIIEDTPTGAGFCYWGAELIAWKGPQATDGSVWENQALFDFGNRALPVLDVFQ